MKGGPMRHVRNAQKNLGCFVRLGGCVTATVIMLVGGVLVAVGVLLSILPLIIAGAAICVFAIVCYLMAKLAANLVDGPG
jgi:hypothetical protein